MKSARDHNKGRPLSRLNTSFVLGYHGCERAVGEKAVTGDLELLHSKSDYDWLGSGIYFWESDPKRALEWAHEKQARGQYKDPFAIGAVIDLRNCLDLTVREDLEILRAAYDSFKIYQEAAGLTIPKNKALPHDAIGDQTLRFLDCAVVRHLDGLLRRQEEGLAIEPYDTVRGLFVEGKELFDGSGFKNKTHVQIAVRNADCIRGVFIPH